MKFIKTALLVSLVLSSCILISCSDDNNDESSLPFAPSVTGNDVLFQAATFGDLLSGEYDGVISYSELGTYGDFGIGTFDGLDGEMLMLDDIPYQIKDDGLACMSSKHVGQKTF